MGHEIIYNSVLSVTLLVKQNGGKSLRLKLWTGLNTITSCHQIGKCQLQRSNKKCLDTKCNLKTFAVEKQTFLQ